MFLSWVAAAMIEARRQRSAADSVLGEHRGWLALLLSAVGLALLLASGQLIVAGARSIAMSFGVDEFVIAATIVALGTSTPELATTIISMLRGHAEVGLGTILGSNIFNGLFILAAAAIICPIQVHWREVSVALIFGFLAVLLTFPARGGFIERRRGGTLLVLYSVYVLAVVYPGTA
jgi:cation:H+ antiporter